MHVAEVLAAMLLVEFFLEAHNQVVVLDRVSDLQKLMRDLTILKQVRYLRPIIQRLVLKARSTTELTVRFVCGAEAGR